MSVPQYYLQRAQSEEGLLTVVQINRMKQRGAITADTYCRAENETTFRRLDEVFPHLKDYRGVDAEKQAKLKRDLAHNEILSLKATGFGSGTLFLLPGVFGYCFSMAAICAGVLLLVRHRQMIGFGAIAMGLGGIFIRVWREMIRHG